MRRTNLFMLVALMVVLLALPLMVTADTGPPKMADQIAYDKTNFVIDGDAGGALIASESSAYAYTMADVRYVAVIDKYQEKAQFVMAAVQITLRRSGANNENSGTIRVAEKLYFRYASVQAFDRTTNGYALPVRAGVTSQQNSENTLRQLFTTTTTAAPVLGNATLNANMEGFRVRTGSISGACLAFT